jgi:hypothetical protein
MEGSSAVVASNGFFPLWLRVKSFTECAAEELACMTMPFFFPQPCLFCNLFFKGVFRILMAITEDFFQRYGDSSGLEEWVLRLKEVHKAVGRRGGRETERVVTSTVR